MGSQIESGLKKAKSQKMQYVLYENLNFEGSGPPKTGPKRLPNWFPISSSTRKPSKSLLRASWKPLGSSWSALGALLDALIALLGPKTLQLSARRARIKPDQVVGPESTDVIICLRPVIICLRPCNHLPTSVQSSAFVRVIICLRPVIKNVPK